MDTKKNSDDVTGSHPDIVIEGGTLLTMVEGDAPLDNARLFIRKDRIIDIVRAEEYIRPEGTEIIDAKGCVIMPGLVNAHSHTAMTIFRGYADDLPLKQWLFEKIFPAEAAHLNPENVYWGSLLGCLEMIASGTTSVIESYFFADDSVRAFHKSGLRAIVAQGIIDLPAPGVNDPEKNLETGKEFLERWKAFSSLITPGLFCHSPLTCSDKTFKGAMELSRQHSFPLQTHLSETSEEVDEIIKKTGLRPVPYLDSLGVLNSDLIAAHSIHLDDAEIRLLSERGVRIVHVPESNMKLSSGVARASEMLKMGLTVGIGTDGCASNNNLDLFKEMDTAAKLDKVYTDDPTNMDAGTVLRMATSGGAQIMGLSGETGSIGKGKMADIIVVDMRRPHLVPLYNPVSSLVYSAGGADVRDVIVNGRILMRDRRFLTLDQGEIMDRARAIAKDIKG